MTRDELAALMDGLAPVLREYNTAVITRLAALEEKANEPGPAGADGTPGRDGRDGQPGLMGIPGADGKDGTDGKDGLGFHDLKHITVVQDDSKRRFTFRYVKGETTLDFGTFTVPTQIYRGVWISGKTYEEGDVTTWDGAQWFAKETTTAKPGQQTGSSRAWQLCVKRGEKGEPGPEGKPGRDLTQLSTKGEKW